MLKKRFCLLLALIILLAPISDVYAESTYSVRLNSSGYLDITSSNYGDKMRLLVEKDSHRFVYSLDGEFESLPLQLGNGNYTVKIMENIKDKRYKVVSKEEVILKSLNDNSSFLGSAQPVYWDKTPVIEKLAKTIVADAKSDSEKVKKIYDYILKNMSYDYDKMSNIKVNYVPNIEETLKTNKGICYDYSAAFAGLLRSLDIPTKLIKGYKNDMEAYHAWNEVYIDGKWQIIDTAYDEALQNTSVNVKMYKKASEYKKSKEF